MLGAIDEARYKFDKAAQARVWSQQQQRAMSLLASSGTARAFDVSQEPEAIRKRYGENINGMSLLLARRLAEAGVPFITVFWLGEGIGQGRPAECLPGWSSNSFFGMHPCLCSGVCRNQSHCDDYFYLQCEMKLPS